VADGDTAASKVTCTTGCGIFTDAANKNFHLTSATAAGANLSSPYNTDPDGVTRGGDGSWDRGAFEYTGGGPVADQTAPSNPLSLAATAVSSSQINLSWTASTDNVGVNGYKIYRAGTQVGTSATNSYSDTGLTANTTYSYTVTAYDAANNTSGSSNTASATTQSAPVAGNYPWSGIINSQRAVDWSQAGVTGGIPSGSWTNCTTTACNTLFGGAVTGANINSAISSAPNNTVVRIPAGTFNIETGIDFKGRSNVALRGMGADQTKLIFIDGIGCLGPWGVVCMKGNDLAYSTESSPLHVANWTAGYAKDTTTITLSNTTGLSVGMYIGIDQLDDASDTGNIFVCAKQGVCTDEGGGGNGRAGRGNRQLTRVTAINGNNVTISPGVAMPNFRSSQSPQAWWGNTNSFATRIGLENLSIDGNSAIRNSDGGANVIMTYVSDSWIKGIRSINAPSPRSHIMMYSSAHVTIRDSYIVGTQADLGHSTNYGYEMFGTANVLVENNISQHRNPMIIANGDIGSVYGYNYGVDSHYDAPLTFMQGTNYSHEVGNGMNLHEGNSGVAIMSDNIHGTSNLVTSFRNYMVGWEPGKIYNTYAVELATLNRYYNFVGNVLGKSGYHTSYQNGGAASIWNLGGASNYIAADPLTISTSFRWGNYDTVTRTSRFVTSEVPTGILYGNAVPVSQSLPASFYLSVKPSWWGTMPWPPIGPDVSGGNISTADGHAYKIPAQVCWDAMPLDPAYIGDPAGVRIFSAANCYSSSGPVQTNTLSITKSGTGSGTVSGGGISCGLTCSVQTSGSITLTATPDTNSTFSGWGGSCLSSGTSPTCTVNVSGSTAVSATFTQSQTPDTTAPVTSITSPLSGSTLSGSATIAVSATDPVISGTVTSGISTVELRVDGTLLSTLTTAPYSGTWNTLGVTNGTHTLTAVARDAAGNTATSNTVTITVSNPLSISSLSAQGGTNTATISWITNRPSTTRVEYGTSTAYSLQMTNASLVSTHSVTLSNLSLYTTYHYRATSVDAQGTSVSSSDGTFITTAAPEPVPVPGGTTGGGGGGGGGGNTTTSGNTTHTSIGTFIPTVVQKPLIPAPCTLVTQTSTTVFLRTLTLGSTGADVKALQQFLNMKGFRVSPAGPGSPGLETMTFGPATKAALIRFQAANNVVPASGLFGPLTKAKVLSLTTTAPAVPGCVATTTPPVITIPITQFTRTLQLGSTGLDVRALQQFLNTHGYTVATTGPGSPGNESMYFGPATKAALIRFQSAQRIVPASGLFGPLTKLKVMGMR
jgi:hypothetical protein